MMDCFGFTSSYQEKLLNPVLEKKKKQTNHPFDSQRPPACWPGRSHQEELGTAGLVNKGVSSPFSFCDRLQRLTPGCLGLRGCFTFSACEYNDNFYGWMEIELNCIRQVHLWLKKYIGLRQLVCIRGLLDNCKFLLIRPYMGMLM